MPKARFSKDSYVIAERDKIVTTGRISSGNLILTTVGGVDIPLGSVIGPQGPTPTSDFALYSAKSISSAAAPQGNWTTITGWSFVEGQTVPTTLWSWNSTTQKFTVNVTGLYICSFSCSFADAASGTSLGSGGRRAQLYMTKSGGSLLEGLNIAAVAAGAVTIGGEEPFLLQQGDLVQPMVDQIMTNGASPWQAALASNPGHHITAIKVG